MFATTTTTRGNGPGPAEGEPHCRQRRFVVPQDSLTVCEQILADAGEDKALFDLSRRRQRLTDAVISREIEALMGRTVIGFKIDNHIDPDLAVELAVLEPAGNGAGR